MEQRLGRCVVLGLPQSMGVGPENGDQRLWIKAEGGRSESGSIAGFAGAVSLPLEFSHHHPQSVSAIRAKEVNLCCS